jgi:mono/diheme cytochrome c family protein
MTMKKPMGRECSLTFVPTLIALAFFLNGSVQAAPEETAARNFKWKDGAEVYAKICGHCHEGGKVGPVIVGRQLPPVYVRTVVRNGSRAMPPFRFSEIDEESLAKLAEYISKSQPAR